MVLFGDISACFCFLLYQISAMGWFDRFVRKEKRASLPISTGEIPVEYRHWFSGNRSKQSVTEARVQGIAVFFRAVNLISELIASLPFDIFRKDGQFIINVQDHPALKALNNPSPILDKFQMRQMIVKYCLLRGNAYVIITRFGNGKVKALDLYKDAYKPSIFKLSGRHWYKFQGIEEPIDAYDVLHFKWNCIDGEYGQNPLKIFTETHGVSLALIDFIGSFYGNGAHLTGALTTAAALTKEQKDSLRESFTFRHGGAENVGSTAILDQGLDYKVIGTTPVDSEYIAVKRSIMADVSNITGVPLSLLADLERATFSNIEELNRQFVTYCLRAWCKLLEAQMDQKLFHYDPTPGLYCQYNLEGLLRGDVKARADYYSKAIAGRWMNPNEVRGLENMNPYEGGDKYEHPLMVDKNQNDDGTGNAND